MRPSLSFLLLAIIFIMRMLGDVEVVRGVSNAAKLHIRDYIILPRLHQVCTGITPRGPTPAKILYEISKSQISV